MHQHRTTVAPTDAALVSRSRRGDGDAFRVLVERHHDAVRLAVALLGGGAELTDATFEVARGSLRREAGSSDAVRPFVLGLAHHLHHAPAPGDDLVRDDSCACAPFREADLPRHAAVAAHVAALPPAWQAALWHRHVERDDDEAVATVIGVPPLKVPWLVEGALETLRRGLVVGHREESPALCLGYALRLERWTAGGGGGGVPRAVLRHAHTCARCAALLDDLRAADEDLGRILARSLLGAAGEGYLAARAGV